MLVSPRVSSAMLRYQIEGEVGGMRKFDDKNEVDDEMMKMRKCEEFESKQNEN